MRSQKQNKVTAAVVRGIGTAAARMPAGSFLLAALGSLAASAAFRWAGKRGLALVAGELIPTFLLFSLYRKMAPRMSWPGFQHELRPGSAKWEGPSEEPAANVSAAATPGVPL
jgi:hypothetical protein